MPLFRRVGKIDDLDRLVVHYVSRRPPGNIPYVVDNIWEWLRPEQMPSRRQSVFASPTPSLAAESAPGGHVGQVHFVGDSTVSQLVGQQGKHWRDAKYHPDCKAIIRLLNRGLSHQGWLDLPLGNKSSSGQIFIPCLGKEEIGMLFAENPVLRGLQDELTEVSVYWKHMRLVPDCNDLPDPEGEILFQALDGHIIKPIRGPIE